MKEWKWGQGFIAFISILELFVLIKDVLSTAILMACFILFLEPMCDVIMQCQRAERVHRARCMWWLHHLCHVGIIWGKAWYSLPVMAPEEKYFPPTSQIHHIWKLWERKQRPFSPLVWRWSLGSSRTKAYVIWHFCFLSSRVWDWHGIEKYLSISQPYVVRLINLTDLYLHSWTDILKEEFMHFPYLVASVCSNVKGGTAVDFIQRAHKILILCKVISLLDKE